MRHTAESGVSLAFVAIILAIAGVAAATMLVASKRDAHWNPIRETQARIEKVNQALIAYQRTHKRLPCPAPLNVVSSHANYGVATATCAGAVEQGAVPFRTLELPEEYGVDAWDMKITYLMNPVLSTAVGFAANIGSIEVTMDNDVFGEAAYVLISHGKDLGSYHKNSVVATNTALSGGIEAENTDGDGEVLQLSHNYLQTSDYFDDIVLWAEVDSIAKVP